MKKYSAWLSGVYKLSVTFPTVYLTETVLAFQPLGNFSDSQTLTEQNVEQSHEQS